MGRGEREDATRARRRVAEQDAKPRRRDGDAGGRAGRGGRRDRRDDREIDRGDVGGGVGADARGELSGGGVRPRGGFVGRERREEGRRRGMDENEVYDDERESADGERKRTRNAASDDVRDAGRRFERVGDGGVAARGRRGEGARAGDDAPRGGIEASKLGSSETTSRARGESESGDGGARRSASRAGGGVDE